MQRRPPAEQQQRGDRGRHRNETGGHTGGGGLAQQHPDRDRAQPHHNPGGKHSRRASPRPSGEPTQGGPAQKRPGRRRDARDVEPLVVTAPPDGAEQQHTGNIDAQPPQSLPRTHHAADTTGALDRQPR